ncbi:MAG: tRNA-2-methylthio-N(6)-dimethylallyladenosine synthase [Candidatus Omnitrophica bacterium]|nr:tRNA-2-methylthio-N(6)-dimethylallyladenosine synthase [Candidatus Omnitrophota bacterium]
MKSVYLQTFGCQMNERDSEIVLGQLFRRGYRPADSPESADLLLYNTCSVRDHAEQRVFGRMGHFKHLKAARPGMVIGILGCMAQEHGPDFFRRNPEIDLVCGTGNLAQVPDLVEAIAEDRAPRLATDRLDAPYALEDAGWRRETWRADITIMVGCDHRCTYCIVPYTRGVERSRASADIVAEVKDLERRGYQEVMLLGQNVNSYGKGLGEDTDFAGLLALLQREAPGIGRIRFTTSHPKDAHTRLFTAMRDLPAVCEHLHLPVQSGSDHILRRMKREHTIGWYLEQIEEYRRLVPDGSLTTDAIVGFPGETEEDFEETVRLFERVRFDAAYLFQYSPRPGTPALKLADDVPVPEKARRLQRLLAVQRAIALDRNRSLIGTEVEVLFEGRSRRAEDRYVGRTRQFKRVIAASTEDLSARTRRVRVTGAADETLLGELI